MSNHKFKLAVIAAFCLQVMLIGFMLFERIKTIHDGQEVVLQSRFVDPRDIFRGHYVRLNLVAGTIGKSLPGANQSFKHGSKVYVGLQASDNGFWIAKSVHSKKPTEEGLIYLEGIYRGNRGNTLNVRFPFDRYFTNKQRAQKLEKLRTEQRLGVVIALNGKGNGIIKGITIDGEIIYDEPLL